MKRGLAWILIFFVVSSILLSNLQIVSSQVDEAELQRLENAANTTQRAAETIASDDADSQDYLAAEWKRILLTNPTLNSIYQFFQKISLFFRVVFGDPFTLSLAFLFSIILWFFFTHRLIDIVRVLPFKFNTLMVWALAVMFSIILANLHIYRFIAELMSSLIFKVPLLAKILILIAYLGMGTIVAYVSRKLLGNYKEAREQKEKEKTQQAQQVIQKTVEGIKEGENAGEGKK